MRCCRYGDEPQGYGDEDENELSHSAFEGVDEDSENPRLRTKLQFDNYAKATPGQHCSRYGGKYSGSWELHVKRLQPQNN